MNEIKCPLCEEITALSEEVKQAFNDLIQANPDVQSIDELGEEEQYEDQDGEEEEQSESKQVKHTETQEEKKKIRDKEKDKSSGIRYETNGTRSSEQIRKTETDKSEDQYFYHNDFAQCLCSMQCAGHTEELYTHYSSVLRRLVCPQCMIDMKEKRVEHNSKPIRRVISLILSNLEDQMSKAQIDMNLAENRLGKIEIKREQMDGQIASIRRKVEIKFNDIIEHVYQIKKDFFLKFDDIWRPAYEGIDQVESDLKEMVNKLGTVISDITKLQSKVVCCHIV